jgi:hypothetical protein
VALSSRGSGAVRAHLRFYTVELSRGKPCACRSFATRIEFSRAGSMIGFLIARRPPARLVRIDAGSSYER